MAALSFSAASAQTYETRFARPLSDVLNDVAARFQVRLKYDVDTVGRVLPYADFRIRPYSLEETLTNVLSPFDYKFVKQSDKVYKLKPYEYARRTDADGEKMLAYLSGLYSDKSQWEQRREILRKEVRQRLGLDDMLGKTVKDAKPVLSKIRKFDGYTVQNFALGIGVNGGSGGGTQTVLLTVLDDRFTAAAPVVSLASHFDGGCPCESGKPIQLAGGGTCNAELAALFAPRPMLVVSDGGDWTATVPRLEYPYLQRIYGFYGATDKVSNVHLPQERHDFGPNKRNAVYDFFIDVFGLDRNMLDESKVTIEPENALKSFGEKGEKLPAGALRYKE